MEQTPNGTPVGVDDPYAHAGICDHLTDGGHCRLAIEPGRDRDRFLEERAVDDGWCVFAEDEGESIPWGECPHYRCRERTRACQRCGLEERRLAHDEERPLLEEHHLSYAADGDEPGHEITVYLCRWCHAKIHRSWARIDDDVAPDQEALAEREHRRSRELAELEFPSAAERED